MPSITLKPLSNQVLKECFKSNVEFKIVSVPGDPSQGIEQQEVKKRIRVLHNVDELEALLIWKSELIDLGSAKYWTWESWYRNTVITLADTAKENFLMVQSELYQYEAIDTFAKYDGLMKGFTEMYCSKLETRNLREMILSAKKPGDMTIRAFTTRLRQLNRYLPELPGPLNIRLREDEICDVVTRSVPSWNRKLVESGNSRMDRLGEVLTYYQELESQEHKDRARNNNREARDKNNNNRNNNRSGDQRGSNRNGGRNNSGRGGGREVDKKSSGNYDGENRRSDNNDRRDRGNRNDDNQSRKSGGSNNRSGTYHRRGDHNRRGYEMRRQSRNEARRVEEKDDDDQRSVSDNSVKSHGSVESKESRSSQNSRSKDNESTDDEVYYADELYMAEETPSGPVRVDTSVDYRPEVVVSLLQDLTTKSKKVLRALVDTGCNRTIVREDMVPKWIRNKAKKVSRSFDTMSGGKLKTESSVVVAFNLVQFSPHRTITHEVVLAQGDKNFPDMVIGRDLLQVLKIQVDYSTDIPCLRWEDMNIPLRVRGSPIDELFLKDSLIDQAEQRWESHSPSMIAASYNEAPVDISKFIPRHLDKKQGQAFLMVLENNCEVFNGQLGTLPGRPIELYLKEDNVKPFHGRAFAIPKVHEQLMKDEIKRLEGLGVLVRVNDSEWAAPSFGIPKKNGQIRFVSDFRQLNKFLRRLPFPLPNAQELFRTIDGFSYCTTMDLNMGFWAIRLSPRAQRLCTIVLPWGKYAYLRLPMGLSCSPDIYQEKISSIFIDLPEVVVYIDDILIITKGSFQDHLSVLE